MTKNNLWIVLGSACIAVCLMSCTTYLTKPDNTPGRATVYSDPGTVGPVAGIGVEPQDIIAMTEKMMRDMMTNPLIVNVQHPPRIIVDAVYFTNESTSRLNLNTITDKLRVGLNRSANGRMIFVGRNYSNMVEKERKLKDSGVVDQGSTPYAYRTLGGDYQLGGRITSLDAVSNQSGLTSRYTQVIFEMVDLQTGEIVWGGEYSFQKTAADDVIYR